MNTPQITIKDGIAYFEQPYKVDFVDFGYAHLDCDSIITEASAHYDEVEVVAYASEEKYNAKLYKIYEESYKGKGYRILQQISSMEASSID